MYLQLTYYVYNIFIVQKKQHIIFEIYKLKQYRFGFDQQCTVLFEKGFISFKFNWLDLILLDDVIKLSTQKKIIPLVLEYR